MTPARPPRPESEQNAATAVEDSSRFQSFGRDVRATLAASVSCAGAVFFIGPTRDVFRDDTRRSPPAPMAVDIAAGAGSGMAPA
jgi:hypothetical protein